MGDGTAPFSIAVYGSEDRISALHEDLLGAIISRLPVTDAARTAVLASRWRHLWRSTPLVLRDLDLPEDRRAAIAARVLADHPGPFRTISLTGCSFASLDLELAEWPRLLAAKGTQQLSLCNKPTGGPPVVSRVPVDILRCASLQNLGLSCLTLAEGLPRVGDGFPNLRDLSLISAATGYQDLEYLLAASPVLQTLLFICDLTPKRVHVSSQSVQSVLVGLSRVEELAVVDAPHLEWLVVLQPPYGGRGCVRIKIASLPNLRGLGYLEPRIHSLQIGDNLIKSDTIVSPSTVVPGIRILVLKVNFGVLSEVKMMASFLRCFPNVDTLHIQFRATSFSQQFSNHIYHQCCKQCDPYVFNYISTQYNAMNYLQSGLPDPSVTASEEPSGEHHAKFWQDTSPVECLSSHVKRMVIHKFRGDQNKFEFIKFLATNAQELQSLLVVRPTESFALVDKVNEMIDKLGCPRFRAWTSKVLLVSPKVDTVWDIQDFDLTSADGPFRQ